MKIPRKSLLLAALLLPVGLQAAPVLDSLYTDLVDCELLSVHEETGASTSRCPGVGGYQLLVFDDDARMSVAVLDSAKRQFDLDYWSAITPTFSELGKKAEWRVSRQGQQVVPVALIVRVNSSGEEKPVSYLAVAKITPEQMCVTDRIEPGAQQNERARAAADVAQDKPCLAP